jgi:RNA polymerase sigma factor (TIGR02999 family)
LLTAVGQGDAAARSKLWRLVYDELRHVAQRQLAREAPGRTLQPTSLVHEVFLRLTAGEAVQFENRRHFFGAAARAMRQIRIDDARRRRRVKRGGGKRPGVVDQEPAVFDQDPAQVLAVDEALKRLEQMDPRKAEIVTLRYFAGLTEQETAAALDLSRRTVQMEWRLAKAWLHRELSKGDTSAG